MPIHSLASYDTGGAVDVFCQYIYIYIYIYILYIYIYDYVVCTHF